MWCHPCLWCCDISESGEKNKRKLMQVDKEDGRTWQTPGKLSFCARILQSGLYSVQGENWRRAGRRTGSPGGNEVLSMNPHLLGFNSRLKQGSKPEQG